MKRLLLLLTAIIPATFVASAQNADEQAAMKAWMDYATPGKVHEMIAQSDGAWTFEMTMWQKPGAPPSTTTGTTENKMILGGRYQESVHRAHMMGMEFEGHGWLGYDNAKKTFQSTWIDNMGSGTMLMDGKWDDATKSVTFTGKGYDPSAGKDMMIKQVHKIVDEDHQVVEMYMVNKGKEFKNMEIKLTRQK